MHLVRFWQRTLSLFKNYYLWQYSIFLFADDCMKIIILIVILFFVLLIIFIKRDNYIPYYSYGWGSDFAKELGLSKIEIRILNYVSHNNSYDRLYYRFFLTHMYYAMSYRKKLVGFYIAFLRNSVYKDVKHEKFKDLFYYCNYVLREKYICGLPEKDTIDFLESVLPDVDKAEIRKLADTWDRLTEEEDKMLFRDDSGRWELFYNKLVENYSDGEAFYGAIVKLESMCITITSKRNIYYKAYRFAVDKDKLVSLRLYIHYLSIGSESETFKHLNISRSNQKILFANKVQKEKFDKIVGRFKRDGNISKALDNVDDVFKVKRKKIELDADKIQSARKDLNEVVNLLNEYLDEEEVSASQSDIAPVAVLSEQDSVQSEFIQFFIDNGYKLSQQEIDIFANRKGVFKSQLIEGINEEFYEELDDLLIEEDGDCYILNENYYAAIKA